MGTLANPQAGRQADVQAEISHYRSRNFLVSPVLYVVLEEFAVI
jgi:hypothetical protein